MHFQLNVSLLLLYLLQIEAEPCTTPNEEQGECVLIDDCPVLANTFANPISNGIEELIKKFKCRGGKGFSVCCIASWNSINYGKELSDRRYCGYQHTDDYFPSERNTTSIDEFPWLAALVITDPNNGKDIIICHGSLINNRYILITARCVTRYRGDANLSKVLLGKYNAENTTGCIDLEGYGLECTEVQEFGIEEEILHPFFYGVTYDDSLWDIALIRLNKTTSYTDYIRPICLPTQGIKVAEVGEILYTTGWGNILYGEPASIKKKVKTILLTPEECKKDYRFATSTYHICTLGLENNTECFYDGGAPVMHSYRNQWQIEGIIPIKSTCGAKYPALYTRVSPYIEWIKQNIRP